MPHAGYPCETFFHGTRTTKCLVFLWSVEGLIMLWFINLLRKAPFDNLVPLWWGLWVQSCSISSMLSWFHLIDCTPWKIWILWGCQGCWSSFTSTPCWSLCKPCFYSAAHGQPQETIQDIDLYMAPYFNPCGLGQCRKLSPWWLLQLWQCLGAVSGWRNSLSNCSSKWWAGQVYPKWFKHTSSVFLRDRVIELIKMLFCSGFTG